MRTTTYACDPEVAQTLWTLLMAEALWFEVWDGALPPSCEAPTHGVRLVRAPLLNGWGVLDPAGALRLTQFWDGLTSERGGFPRYWRIVTASGVCQLQGLRTALQLHLIPAHRPHDAMLQQGEQISLWLTGVITIGAHP